MVTVGSLAVKSFVSKDASLRDAAKVMVRSGIGGAAAIDEKGRLSFLVTDNDIANALARGEDPEVVKAIEYATLSPLTVKPDVDALEALRIMKRYDISHLPVVENNKVLGIAYARDLVFAILDHVPVGKAVIADSAKPLIEVSEDTKVSEAVTEMVRNDVEAVKVGNKLFTIRDMLHAVAEGEPYEDPVSKYANDKVIVTDERSDLFCALSLMKSNKVEYLMLWNNKYVNVKDLAKVVPDIVKELLRFVILSKKDVNIKGAIRTAGKYKAVIVVEGEDELRKVLDAIGGDVEVLVERG